MSDTQPADDTTTTDARATADQASNQASEPASEPASDPWAAKVDAALRRYRVMAWVTGTMLLVLCLEMVLKYVVRASGLDAEGHAKPVLGSWVAFAHGWIYVVYLGVVFDLWSKMRWPLRRLAAMAAAGVVPVMSFVLERRVHAGVVERLDALAGRRSATR